MTCGRTEGAGVLASWDATGGCGFLISSGIGDVGRTGCVGCIGWVRRTSGAA